MLGRYIAYLSAGYHAHVAKVLLQLKKLDSTSPHTQAVAAALRALAPPQNEQQRFHRDGWLFQFIAWIAALSKASTNDVVRAPQTRKAEHGLDGLIVHFSSTSTTLPGVRICEQKATDNPRLLIHNSVWKEFEAYELNKRDNELIAELTTLLQAVNAETAQDLAAKSLWEGQKSYSVAVTVTPKHVAPKEHSKLFSGFDSSVKGDVRRRHGETLPLSDLRSWMDDLATLVSNELHTIHTTKNV